MRKPSTALALLAAVSAVALTACERDRPEVDELAAIAVLQEEVASLDERAQRLRDAADIRRLQRAYGFYIDKAQWDEAADLFAEDASIEFGHEGAYIGRGRIREYYLRHGNGETGLKHGQLNNHMQLQPVVHVAEDGLTAEGRWRAFSMVGQFGEKAVWAEGPYENEYVKEDGVWKISRLRWYPTFVVPYEDGWSGAEPGDGWRSPAAEDFPPDREPTDAYPLFPAMHVVPYHYPHPVTERTPGLPDGADTPPVDVEADTPEAAALRAAIAERRAQLERLEGYQAVENLQAIYGYYFDRNLWDEVADLFTADATFEYGQYGVYRGRDRVREGLELFGEAGPQHGQLNNHFQLQPVITVADDSRSALARWRGIQQRGRHGESAEWGEGVYENEYVREGGVWRISRLHYYVTVIADYEEGWAGDGPRPMPPASERIPPDAPPTEVYESLPGVHIPPFHYPHPVAGHTVEWPGRSTQEGER